MNYYIGWDVGTWKCKGANKKSCDALVLMDDERILGHHRDNLSRSISSIFQRRSDEQVDHLLSSWLEKCDLQQKPSKADYYVIAIDTPLGWPKGFVNLLKGEHPSEWDFCCNDPDINNPLLFRRTERELRSGFSAVTHSIGDQSTKGIALISALKAEHETWGVWRKDNITLIETYPKACLCSEEFVRWMVSLNLNRDIREWYKPVIERKQQRRVQVQDDTFDAAVCACLAKAFVGKSPTLVSPPEDDSNLEKSEGWIFYPAGERVHESVADGHSSMTNSSTVSSFSQALKAFQSHVESNKSKKRTSHNTADSE